MKVSATLLLVLAGLGCTSLLSEQSARGNSRITLEILAVSRTADGGVEANVRLTNGSERPFAYLGYPPHTPFPSSTTEVWDRWHWREVQLLGCGVGVQTLAVAPGQSVVFNMRIWTHVGDSKLTKVRLVLHEAGGQRVVRSKALRVIAQGV